MSTDTRRRLSWAQKNTLDLLGKHESARLVNPSPFSWVVRRPKARGLTAVHRWTAESLLALGLIEHSDEYRPMEYRLSEKGRKANETGFA